MMSGILVAVVLGAARGFVCRSASRPQSELRASLLDQVSRLEGSVAQTESFVSSTSSYVSSHDPLIAALAVTTAAAMAGTGAWLLTSLAEKENVMLEDSPYPSGEYDFESAASYFGRRPSRCVSRALGIAGPAVQFGLDVLLAEDGRAPERLVDSLTRLGPTFIKVGQALSIRSDLLPPEYCDALAQLQDKVPPFETAVAKRVVREELGQAAEDVFLEFPDAPIASASLGQVYKARRRATKNEVVAVKVQRPDVVETIALDLYLLRLFAPPTRALFGLNTDLAGIVDAWGEKFVDELDYRKEAANAVQFAQSIAETPLAGAVFAPEVVPESSSSRVLTTAWVDGDRLDRCDSTTIAQLCGVAMNAYLTMMLETGTLHADPHPGNLLVEKDSHRLAILDWGLVTTLEEDLRVSYIEHIAHLVAKDYAKVPRDLVTLGFVPPGFESQIESTDAVRVLSDVYTQFAGGGGAAKIDVPAVLDQLRGLADRQGNLFRLPPYFAYIARAFSVLEGIGLQNDPDYSIVQECLPYVSQRLISDPSPRVAKALETFIYDSEKRVDAKRVGYLLDGLGSYSRSATDDVLQTATRLADLLLDHSPTQEIVERELAKLVGAAARSAASRFRDQTEPIAALLDPLRLLEPLARGPLVEPDADDQLALAVFARIQTKASPQLAEALDEFAALEPETRATVLRHLLSLIWDRREAAVASAARVSLTLAQQTADRLLNR